MIKSNNYVPCDKLDLGAVARARKLGFPRINELIPELLTWTQDSNWPVAKPIKNILADAGPKIAPHFNSILNSDDANWKYHVIDLAKHFDENVWDLVSESVHRITTQPTQDELNESVNELAAEIIQARG